MLSAEQIDRAKTELAGAAHEAFARARAAERALENYDYPRNNRPYEPSRRAELLAEYNEADYMAESRAWIHNLMRESTAPHVTMRPRVFQDGNQWCALLGDNLQVGIAGFGDSPAIACEAFDRAWNTKLEEPANAR